MDSFEAICAHCNKRRGAHYNGWCTNAAYSRDAYGHRVSPLLYFAKASIEYIMDRYQRKVTIGDKVSWRTVPGDENSLRQTGEVRDICRDSECGDYACIEADGGDTIERGREDIETLEKGIK